jgi:hypothetical protein
MPPVRTILKKCLGVVLDLTAEYLWALAILGGVFTWIGVGIATGNGATGAKVALVAAAVFTALGYTAQHLSHRIDK